MRLRLLGPVTAFDGGRACERTGETGLELVA